MLERVCGRAVGLVVMAMLVALLPGRSAEASAGSADQGFGSHGFVQTDLSGLDIGLDVLVQPDGKAVTVGYADSDGILLRHRTDGDLDPGFGVGGVVRTEPPSFLQAGVLQADGRIVVVGSSGALDDVVLFRYLPSGAPDGSFGAGGFVRTDLGGIDEADAVALQPDGKVVIVGRSGDALAVARYLPDGVPDTTFGTGGMTTTTFGAGTSSQASSLGILSTGAIVVGGRTSPSASGDATMLLARYGADGVLDGAFGTGGRVAPADRRLSDVTSLVVQPADRVVVAGASGGETVQVPTMARYRADGSLDPAFGLGGSTTTPLGTSATTADLTLDGSGRLLAVGAASYSDPGAEPGPFSFVTVSRFTSDGIADGGFGCAGSTQAELPTAAGGRGTGIAIAPGGRILVSGIAFTDATTDLGSPDFLLGRIQADGAPTPGYWITRSDGGISAFGSAGACGSLRGLHLDEPIVGHAARASGDGYWFVASDGGVFTRGDAPFLGSTGGIALDRPVVGMAATPSGQGYWLVASDGGIFTFGDARFLGSTGGIALDRPVVGMAATPSGLGYWLVASDGGIFTFGDARFLGSTGGIALDRPVVGMAATPSGQGYWLVASDGGIFTFADARFLGSTGGMELRRPVVGMKATRSGRGYWLTGEDGSIFAYGDAEPLGSTGGNALQAPAVAIT